MDIKVVDASALAALLFDEPEADGVAHDLKDARLVAPALIGFELANVCLVKSRRDPERSAEFASAFARWTRLGIKEVAVDHHAVLGLAIATRLTVYDASYLWVSHQLGAVLVTLDRQLQRATAASRSG